MSNTPNLGSLLQAIGALSITTPNSALLDDNLALTEKPKVYPMDPLVLSCARYRRGKELPTTPPSSDVSDQEYARTAHNIRSYYRGKLTRSVLYGQKLTPFRQDLAEFMQLPDNETQVFPKFEGMIYRLPEMYEYDSKIDHMIELYRPKTGPFGSSDGRHYQQLRLTPVFCFKHSPTRISPRKSNRHWMYDQNSGRLVRMDLSDENVLYGLWNSIWERGQTIELSAFVTKRRFDEINYYGISRISEFD